MRLSSDVYDSQRHRKSVNFNYTNEALNRWTSKACVNFPGQSLNNLNLFHNSRDNSSIESLCLDKVMRKL